LRLLQHDLRDAEQDGHHRHAGAEADRQHGAAHRMRGEGAQREPADHRVVSLSTRPSRMVSTRWARDAARS
jgi:hypothetical protein